MAVDIAIQTDAIKCRGNFLMVCYSDDFRWDARVSCVLLSFLSPSIIVVGFKSIIWRSIKFHSFSLVFLWVYLMSCQIHLRVYVCACVWVCRMCIATQVNSSQPTKSCEFQTRDQKKKKKNDRNVNSIDFISVVLKLTATLVWLASFPLMQFNILLCLTILIW